MPPEAAQAAGPANHGELSSLSHDSDLSKVTLRRAEAAQTPFRLWYPESSPGLTMNKEFKSPKDAELH